MVALPAGQVKSSRTALRGRWRRSLAPVRDTAKTTIRGGGRASRRIGRPSPRLGRGRRERGAADLASGLDLCWRVELDVSAMTEAAQQTASRRVGAAASKEPTVIGADIRRGEWGSKFPTDLVRDFIRSSLRHSRRR